MNNLRLTFSLFSKKTKNLSKSLHRSALSISVNVEELIELKIQIARRDTINFIFYTSRYRANPYYDPNAGVVLIDNPDEYIGIVDTTKNSRIWMHFPNMGIRDFVDHFFDVLSLSKLDEFSISKDNYCTQEFCDEFKELDVQTFVSPLQMDNSSFYQKIIRMFSSRSKRLDFGLPTFPFKTHTAQEFMFQNFNFFQILYKCSLVEVLSINSTLIYGEDLIGVNQLNVFLRHWINGSNPRLEYFQFYVYLQTSLEDLFSIIFNKVNYQRQPDSLLRAFCLSVQGYDDLIYNLKKIKGGMDIERTDGARATVKINGVGHNHFVQFFKWDNN